MCSYVCLTLHTPLALHSHSQQRPVKSLGSEFYWSSLVAWRHQREQGIVAALLPSRSPQPLCAGPSSARGPTWQPLQPPHDLLAPLLHGDPVIAHHQGKHHQGHELAGVGLAWGTRETSLLHRPGACHPPGEILRPSGSFYSKLAAKMNVSSQCKSHLSRSQWRHAMISSYSRRFRHNNQDFKIPW